jgi:GNAT superfamily N-acetyltransferase
MSFTVDGRQMETLSEIDSPGIASLFHECAGYWTLITGRAAGKADVTSLLTDRPPMLGLSNKLVLGLREGRRLVAIVDALRDYPGAGTWWLGLLLITPDSRGRGLGRRLYAALESWTATQGASEIRLCVQAQNTRGHRFWQSLGFVALSSQTLTLQGLASEVTTYSRSVGGDGAALP